MKIKLLLLLLAVYILTFVCESSCKAPNTCRNPKTKFNCPQLTNIVTANVTGSTFYYYNRICEMKEKDRLCIQNTGCKACYIPEISKKRYSRKKDGFERCPECVYNYWKIPRNSKSSSSTTTNTNKEPKDEL